MKDICYQQMLPERLFFVLAVTSRLLLFSSAASWKVISAAGIPLSSLSYKYEKQNIHSSVTVQFLTLL